MEGKSAGAGSDFNPDFVSTFFCLLQHSNGRVDENKQTRFYCVAKSVCCKTNLHFWPTNLFSFSSLLKEYTSKILHFC